MLRRSQALETPQLGFRELNGGKSCWTWPGSAPKPPRPSPEPSEPSPEPGWTWPGACTSAHQSYSGLKTPLADAVWGKTNPRVLKSIFSTDLRGIHQQNSVFPAFPGQYSNLEVSKTLCHHWWVVSVWCGWGKGSFLPWVKNPREDENSVLMLAKNYPYGYMYDIMCIYIYTYYIYIYISWYIIHIYVYIYICIYNVYI